MDIVSKRKKNIPEQKKYAAIISRFLTISQREKQ
jgi:hypothetical protein